MRGLEEKGDHSEGGKGKTQSETRKKKKKTQQQQQQKIIIKMKKTKQRDTRTPNEVRLQMSVTVWSKSSLLEIDPSSAAEERVCVVSKQGCYMFS